MWNFLTLRDFPFLLTLLFGLVGYQVNNITESIQSSPSIEYCLCVTDNHVKGDTIYRDYECLITNITSNTSFKNLTINFQCNEKNSLRMFNPQIYTVPPSSRYYEDPESLDKVFLVYKISTLQPADKYKLLFKTSILSKDINSEPSLYLTANETVRIIERSILTWIVKNFLIVNVSLLIFWFVMISLYIVMVKRKGVDEKESIG
jgi:hypothetical protein